MKFTFWAKMPNILERAVLFFVILQNFSELWNSCKLLPYKVPTERCFYATAAIYNQICTELLSAHSRMTHIPGISLSLCKPTPALTAAVGLISLKNANDWVRRHIPMYFFRNSSKTKNTFMHMCAHKHTGWWDLQANSLYCNHPGFKRLRLAPKALTEQEFAL